MLKKTRQNAAFLWMYSLVDKNKAGWTKEEKKVELKTMIDEAVKVDLISKEEAEIMDNVFGIGVAKGILKPFTSGQYLPHNLLKEILGMIGIK